MDRIVLAYSGGLDTAVAIPWLAERYGAEIVTVTVDLGQGGELEEIRERALATGAARAHVLDVREAFAALHVLPALQADALYEDRVPLGTALSRPLIARALIEIAGIEGAAFVAHGASGKGTDQVRFDAAIRALNPALTVIAPARQWGLTRPAAIAYARQRGIPVSVSTASPFSTDANLWGRVVAGGVLEDPWAEPPEGVYTLTKAPSDAPVEPALVEIAFEGGVPTSVNGVTMPLVELIDTVAAIAGVHGVGRIDVVENRLVGIKSREVYEAPAAVVLHAAHRELQQLVVPSDLDRVARQMSLHYADQAYGGLWFSPLREALDGFVRAIQPRVTGIVRLRLGRGDCRVVGRQSPFGLYDQGLATAGEGGTFDPAAAEGFTRIWGLAAETAARVATGAASPQAGTGSDR